MLYSNHFLKNLLICLILLHIMPGCTGREPPRFGAPPDVANSAAVRSGVWILINSQQEKLTVFRDGKPEVVFDNLAFGAAGVGRKTRRGDDVTPKGVYTVGWITRQSKFVHFIGLNYPSLADAQYGLDHGAINRKTYDSIARAHARGETPAQDTALGGLIGIHGVGRGSLEIHRLANWTAGCVAIENEQIARLTGLVQRGTVVEIR